MSPPWEGRAWRTRRDQLIRVSINESAGRRSKRVRQCANPWSITRAYEELLTSGHTPLACRLIRVNVLLTLLLSEAAQLRADVTQFFGGIVHSTRTPVSSTEAPGVSKTEPCTFLTQSASATPAPKCRGSARRSALTWPRVAAAAALALLTACASDGPSVSAPRVSDPALSTTANARTTPARAARLPAQSGACVVAVRTAAGTFLSHSATLTLPPGFVNGAGPVVRVGYRGWSTGSPEPTQMALCAIRDNPAARRHIAEHFGGRVMNDRELFRFAEQIGVAGVEQWRYGQAPRVQSADGEPPVLVLDGVAHSRSEGHTQRPVAARLESADASPNVVALGDALVSAQCGDPLPIMPEEPTCDGGGGGGGGGWSPEPEPVQPVEPPGPSPDPETGEPVAGGEPSLTIGEGTVSPNPCQSGTDYVHITGTPGYGNNINVHSWGRCQRPVQFNIQTWLARWRCSGLWIFSSCAYRTISAGLPITFTGTSTRSAIATATCAWRTGWYMGYGLHRTVSFEHGGETWLIRTASLREQYIQCWF